MSNISPDTATEQDFVISRIFNAPRERVWDAWTKPEQIARWFGPKDVTTTIKQSDVRPGGMLHSCMQKPDGFSMWSKFVYREVDRPQRLVWVQSFSDEKANVARAPFFDGRWPLELLTRVTFEEDGTGTRVTLRWTPMNATPEELATFADNMTSLKDGWTNSLDQLDQLLAG